jgi:hypothetical protein
VTRTCRAVLAFGGAVVALALVVASGVAIAGQPRRYEGTFTVLESPDHGPQLCYFVRESYPPQCDGLPVSAWDWNAVDDEESVNGTTWGGWHVVGTYDGQRFHLSETPGPVKATPAPSDESDFSPVCSKPAVVDASQGGAAWEALWGGDFGPFRVAGAVSGWVSNPNDTSDGAFVGNVIVRPGKRDAAVRRIREHYGGPLCVVERNLPTEARLRHVQAEVMDRAARSVFGDVQDASPDGRRGVIAVTVWVADERARTYAHRRWGRMVELRGLLRPTR